MAESPVKLINYAIKASEYIYHRLILLVGESGSGKTKTLNKLGENLAVKSINLNLLLSQQILGMTDQKRSLHLPKLLEDAIREQNENEIIIFDNIEILFDTNLKQDPLRLLQKNSRNKTIISSWSGRQEESKLLYAEAGHPEYKAYEIKDFLTVNMNGQCNFNPDTSFGEVDKECNTKS